MRVLVVEDMHVIALDIIDTLEYEGYTVVNVTEDKKYAVDAEEAFNVLVKEKVDVVVMDIVLAGAMSGIELAEQIYEEFGIQSIFTTAYDSFESIIINRDYCAGIVYKPYNYAELKSILYHYNEDKGE